MNGSSSASSVDLYITHLDHVGPYLKLYGQANRDAAFLISKRIETLLPGCFAIEPTWSNERQQALLIPGTFCILKRTNGAAPGDVEYMRTRVLNAAIDDKHPAGNRTQMRVEIEFLDYGFKRNVSSHDVSIVYHMYISKISHINLLLLAPAAALLQTAATAAECSSSLLAVYCAWHLLGMGSIRIGYCESAAAKSCGQH